MFTVTIARCIVYYVLQQCSKSIDIWLDVAVYTINHF